MSLTRRNFLVSGSLSLAAGALSPLLVQTAKSKPSTPADFNDWESVRREFELAPDYIHLALFFLASHPRPVRQARTSPCRSAGPSPATSVAIPGISRLPRIRQPVSLFSITDCHCAKVMRS